MNRRRDTFEYLEGVEKFMECAREDMRVRAARSIPCPCIDCQNILRQPSVEILQDHLIARGFVLGYTQWVKHEESKEDTCNIIRPIRIVPDTNSDDNTADLDSSSDVWEEVVVENVKINVQNFDDQCINDKLDEMMTDVEPNFVDTPGLFETLIMKKDIPLFFGCTFFSKMTATFKLYNLKAKNRWSDKSFDSFLDLLREVLPEKK
jgi:Transposase-associated domain